MRLVFAILFCLFGCAAAKAEDSKPEAKKPQVCWESIVLYDDSDFEEEMDPDSNAAKNFRKKTPKYEAEIKVQAEKVLADKGVELVECPDHSFDGSGLKRVAAADKPLHLRLSFAYDGLIIITAYVKVEVMEGDKVIIAFKKEKNADIITLWNREKRRAIITEFGIEVFKAIGDKISDWNKDKK